MSLASATNRVDYVGNGAVSTYSYTFRIFANTDLLVTVRDTSGDETELTLTTDFTVTGVGDAGGGNILLVNASQAWLTAGKLTSGYSLTIRRVRPLTQSADIRNQGDFFPETHEDAFDHFIMVDQQQQDELDRSVKLPETVAASGFDTALPANIADNPGLAIVVNDDGDGFALATATGSVTLPVSVGNGGTNSGTALNNNRMMKSSGGSIVEAAAITAARALISDANGITTHSLTTAAELLGLNALTASRAIVTTAGGILSASTVTSTQVGYLPNLWGYRRPTLVFVSVTTVDVENNTGTLNETRVVFPDGESRSVTEDTASTNKYRRFLITAAAEFTSGTEDSGVRSGISEATNTWYAMYAVKSLIDATKFVIAADTTLPVQANFATLNSRYGTNGWAYLGLIRNGDDSGSTGDILSFRQAGNLTLFTNLATGGSANSGRGVLMLTATTATTATYNYAAGTAGKVFPSVISICQWTAGVNVGSTGTVAFINAAGTFGFTQVTNQVSAAYSTLFLDPRDGMLTSGPASSNHAAFCSGFVDGALGAANPLL